MFTYPCVLKAGAKRSRATCHMAMSQCCYLTKEAKRRSNTTNMLAFSNQGPYILAVTALKASKMNSGFELNVTCALRWIF